MKTDIQTLKDSLQASFDAFAESRKLAETIWEYYHNRQFTQAQETVLENRGQPKETFNIIRMFTRMIIGYFSMVINDIKILPRQQSDIIVANLLNDVIQYVLQDNNFDTLSDLPKIDGLLSGLMCVYVNVQEGSTRDMFNRAHYNIGISYVPSNEILIDYNSKRSDYKDGRFIHRFKWLPKDVFVKIFGEEKLKEVDANQDFLNIDTSDYNYNFQESYGPFDGTFKVEDNYLVVHSIVENDKDELEEVFWCSDTELHRENLTQQGLPNPYIIVRMNESTKVEYYGIFKDIIETQKAINQAIVRIQLLVNTNKAFVEEGAVENLEEFKAAFERVNSVIPVLNLQGIKIENLSQDIVNQYNIINSALDRIQKILGINDSFLGMAYASDSGRKVKLQQNATITALRYIAKRYETFYKLLGEILVTYIKKYYTANRILRIADEITGERWIEINKPLLDQNGQPILVPLQDSESNYQRDENGNIKVTPLQDPDTTLKFTNVDIVIVANAYNDEDERNQLLLETFINGATGQALLTVNPAGFFKIASMNIKNMKSRYSYDIAQVLEQTASMLQPQPQMQQMLGYAKQAGYKQAPQQSDNAGPMSQELKLPTNTNEGLGQ
jgi:hypothetical protein